MFFFWMTFTVHVNFDLSFITCMDKGSVALFRDCKIEDWYG